MYKYSQTHTHSCYIVESEYVYKHPWARAIIYANAYYTVIQKWHSKWFTMQNSMIIALMRLIPPKWKLSSTIKKEPGISSSSNSSGSNNKNKNNNEKKRWIETICLYVSIDAVCVCVWEWERERGYMVCDMLECFQLTQIQCNRYVYTIIMRKFKWILRIRFLFTLNPLHLYIDRRCRLLHRCVCV